MKQYVGISRDHSGSMSSLRTAAMKDYNNNITAIKKASVDNDIDTIISVVKCGVGRGSVEIESINSSIYSIKPLSHYSAEGGTPLFDSIGELIKILENTPDANAQGVTFLVLAVTDGEENQSGYWKTRLESKIKELQATDKWTFAFRVPRGYKAKLAALGIPEGNIQEWEQTERGMEESSRITVQATQSYYQNVTRGITSSKNFYADADKITSTQAKSKMVDISQEVRIWDVKKGGEQIRPFVERQLGQGMRLGAAFYQLTKPEKEVQEYKLIVIREKKTGKVYAGQSARDLLNLPYHGTIKLAPGDHGDWDIFIQSTSVNRLLIAGTNVMYWEQATPIQRNFATLRR